MRRGPGISVLGDGRAYVRLRNGNKQLFSRSLMEAHVGRELAYEEVVHHKNGDKTDDRIENLEILTRAEHAAIHMDEMVAAIKAHAKLGPNQVAFIKASKERTSVLARRFGVTDGAIVHHRGPLLKAHGRT